ncbi:DUF3293 domain-containing protein [Prescottella defluvii]|uniref:DUF3293 domain-containing protein n=1 Tax=Prescottella defluvii TaxID=1323361 RepID=UPI0004F3CAEC|nr:DUF3293 domain-containing protein [Prescottella defluvii]
MNYEDFAWTPSEQLAALAESDTPWQYYLRTRVRFDPEGPSGTVWPLSDHQQGGDTPPLGRLHVITAVQPDADPDSDDSLARMALLDRSVREAGLRSIRAVGSSFDGAHSEDSRAVIGLDDAQARELGARFGQVAVFAWNGPRWSLLACATERETHRPWRWESHS